MSSKNISLEGRFSEREREELRYLRIIKGLLKRAITERTQREGETQAQIAEKAGMDPATLSRALRSDRHVNTKTLFDVAWALDREWVSKLENRRVSAHGNHRASAPLDYQITTTTQVPEISLGELTPTAASESPVSEFKGWRRVPA